MHFKSIFLSILIFGTISFSQFEGKYAEEKKLSTSIDCDTYNVRLLIGDVWWILVYNCDGTIINAYPDPN